DSARLQVDACHARGHVDAVAGDRRGADVEDDAVVAAVGEGFVDREIVETFANGGDEEHRLPGNLNVSFAYVEGEALMMAIKDIAVSSGSACTSASLEPSYVLRALGVGDELAHSSIR